MKAKLYIDLSRGILEVEGGEVLVMEIYRDFTDRLDEMLDVYANKKQEVSNLPPSNSIDLSSRESNSLSPNRSVSDAPIASKEEVTTKTQKPKESRTRRKKKETYSIVKDLNLYGDDLLPSLKEFYEGYDPQTNYERNLVFVSYLKTINSDMEVTLDHIYSCYSHLDGVRIPVALYQSLAETSSDKGWLDTTSMNNITITIPGQNHLDHELGIDNG